MAMFLCWGWPDLVPADRMCLGFSSGMGMTDVSLTWNEVMAAWLVALGDSSWLDEIWVGGSPSSSVAGTTVADDGDLLVITVPGWRKA